MLWGRRGCHPPRWSIVPRVLPCSGLKERCPRSDVDVASRGCFVRAPLPEAKITTLQAGCVHGGAGMHAASFIKAKQQHSLCSWVLAKREGDSYNKRGCGAGSRGGRRARAANPAQAPKRAKKQQVSFFFLNFIFRAVKAALAGSEGGRGVKTPSPPLAARRPPRSLLPPLPAGKARGSC